MPHRIIRVCIVGVVKPHELIAELVRRTKKPLLRVATEMHSRGFQGTLHKFIDGQVRSPSRATAERIARYFKIDVDALYNADDATRIARERGLLTSSASQPTTLVARQDQGRYEVAPLFSKMVEERIRGLGGEQRKALEALVIAYLNAVAPSRTLGKRAG